jgi:folate-dependent phosphoribosylglycinamide formyltransferase PurN
MRHIALFSQTGSEIANLIDKGFSPTSIFFDQKDDSKIDSRLWGCATAVAENRIMKKYVKDIQYLRDCFGDPSTCFITLHGWLNIIPKEICEEYEIYNGHPGLITVYPDLKGKDPQVRAFNGNYMTVGSVIHRVTPGVDEGEVIMTGKKYNDCDTLDQMFELLRGISLTLWVDFFDSRYDNNIRMKELKTTGKPRQFETGAQRDNADGKLRMSLVPHKALDDLMVRYLQGAETYGENNWKKGMKHSVLYDSATRHLRKDFTGDESEDHLGAVLWNVMGMIWNRDNKPELDDRKDYE